MSTAEHVRPKSAAVKLFAEDDNAGGIPGENAEAGPGAAFVRFVRMEELVEKLKLLKYDDLFCKEHQQKPISRHYFALVTNSGEQFGRFALFAAWLIKLCGRKMDFPQETDDPNAVIATILHNLRALGLKPDFPPNKLKTGSGEYCIWVLNRLADESLKAAKFSFASPSYPSEKDISEEIDADEAESIDDDQAELSVDDRIQEIDDFEDEETVIRVDDIKIPALHSSAEEKELEQVMESTVDAAEWRLEVERVLPQLKISMRSENKDWRIHLESMNHYRGKVETCAKDIRVMLGRLSDDLLTSMEKISNRERCISQQLRAPLNQMRDARNALAEVKEIYRMANTGIAEKTRSLAELTDELELVKREMEERGFSMTDGSPVVKIRQAIAQAQRENNQMDIRIGVLQHMLLRHTLKQHRRFDMGDHNRILIY